MALKYFKRGDVYPATDLKKEMERTETGVRKGTKSDIPSRVSKKTVAMLRTEEKDGSH